MFKLKHVAFVSLLALSSVVFANQEVCPELSDIQAEGLSIPIVFDLGYGVFQMSNYNTDTNWVFGIAPIEADSEEELIETANDILSSMFAPGVPEPLEDKNLCTYDTGVDGVFAVAFESNFFSPMQFKQMMSHHIKRS